MNSGHDENIGVISVDGNLATKFVYKNFSSSSLTLENINRDSLAKIINKLGEESSKAQKLQITITTAEKFTATENGDLIFLLFHRKSRTWKEIGLIRFGKRDLYLDDGSSLKHIVNCLCILDFYIRYKRCGYGKIIFDLVLKHLDVSPKVLAYDRPSLAMLAFLKRHYSLDQPLWQHNHFVIFSDIFSFYNLNSI